MQILFLSAWFPYPADNGSKLRIYNLLRGLSSQHDITLISFADKPHTADVDGLQSICKSVHVIPNRDYNAYSKQAIWGFFGQKPRVLTDRYVPEMADAIRKEISTGSYDLVIASQIYMADYYDNFSSIPSIFEEAEVGVFTDAVQEAGNWISRSRRQLTLYKLQSYFRTLLPSYSSSTVVSEAEKALLQNLVPGYSSIELIPNGVSTASYADVAEQPRPGSLIFTGALTYSPNFQAMEWFSSQVLPFLKITNPDVQLVITGNRGGKKLPDDPHISLVGYVDDIRPLIASSWISLAPIFSGGGTRLKILEAFGLRTPVIATSKGAEGLEVRHEKHLLIADSAESFAQETNRLLNDADLRKELVINALDLVHEKYDWEVIMPKFLSMIRKAV
jgi:glycosyltransferase involved in cell wall biosynthesis